MEPRKNTMTYSEYEFQLHSSGIALWSTLMSLFFCGMFFLDILGNIHTAEDGANPASFPLFCLFEICNLLYMRKQINRGNASQVKFV